MHRHRYLLTGIAGFIGFHVARRLLDDGQRVTGLDNFSDYYSPALKRARVSEIQGRPGLELIELDLCDRDRMRALFDRVRPTHVCHLAAQAGVRHSISHPFEYVRSNLLGFLTVLECARAVQVERLVYASSSSVYRASDPRPSAESDRVDRPISLYAATKGSNELMAHAYSHLYGLQTVGLRLFTAYGPWGRPDMAVWLFARAIQQGRTIQFFATETAKQDLRRNFTYIDDLAAGIVSALTAGGLQHCELINLGGAKPISILELIRRLERRIGRKARIEYVGPQPGDVPVTHADTRYARRLLDFQPTVSLDDGVNRFMDWLEQHEELATVVDKKP